MVFPSEVSVPTVKLIGPQGKELGHRPLDYRRVPHFCARTSMSGEVLWQLVQGTGLLTGIVLVPALLLERALVGSREQAEAISP